MSRDNYLERIAERVKEVREKPIDGDSERKHKWYMKNRDRILAQCKENYKRRKTMSRDKKAMEKYLLARGIGFPRCPECPERKEGCHKNCKFIKAYKKEKNDE